MAGGLDRVAMLVACDLTVIAAKAAIFFGSVSVACKNVPAFAGMTVGMGHRP
jgi:hypothetical protein